MTVSYENSKAVFDGIKAAGIRSISALPETWLGPARYGMDFALPENAFRFRRRVQERRAAATGWTPPPLPTTSGAA